MDEFSENVCTHKPSLFNLKTDKEIHINYDKNCKAELKSVKQEEGDGILEEGEKSLLRLKTKYGEKNTLKQRNNDKLGNEKTNATTFHTNKRNQKPLDKTAKISQSQNTCKSLFCGLGHKPQAAYMQQPRHTFHPQAPYNAHLLQILPLNQIHLHRPPLTPIHNYHNHMNVQLMNQPMYHFLCNNNHNFSTIGPVLSNNNWNSTSKPCNY